MRRSFLIHPALRSSRLIVLGVLCSLVLSALAACGGGGSSSGGVVNLVYWNFSQQLKDNADLFNKSHPGIHVTSLRQESQGYYPKLSTALKAGNAPDLALVEYQLMPTMEATGGLVDVSKYGANDIKGQFVPWTWSQLSAGGAVYGIPQDTGPMAMYYRKDLFDKIGYTTPPATWAQYADAAVKLHALNPSYYITSFPPKSEGWFVGMMWQGGAHWFSANGSSWKVTINDDNSKKVASYWQDLVTKKVVKTEPDFSAAWNTDLGTGGVATWISAVWGQNVIATNAPTTSGKWAVAPMPQWTAGGTSAGNWGGSATVVTTSSKHPKEAAEFAEWLNSDTDSIATEVKGVGLYPASISGENTPAVNAPNAYYGGQVVNQVFADAGKGVDTSWQWGPTMVTVYNTQGDLFSSAVDKGTSFADALDQLQQKTVQDMQAQGFTVSS